MTYNLKKLTKKEIEEIVKSLPAGFIKLVNFGTSNFNKNCRVTGARDTNIKQLYDRNTSSICDLWGEYDKEYNYIMVMAEDDSGFAPVEVYLYDDHFEIPAYRNGRGKYEKSVNQDAYREKLSEIFTQKEESIKGC